MYAYRFLLDNLLYLLLVLVGSVIVHQFFVIKGNKHWFFEFEVLIGLFGSLLLVAFHKFTNFLSRHGAILVFN